MDSSVEQDKRYIMLGLRDMLYSKQRLNEALDAYRPIYESLEEAHPNAVLGAVAEMAIEGTNVVAVIAGFANGNARLFWTTGSGIMGDLDEYPRIAEAAKLFVRVAQLVVTSLPIETARPLPAPGRVRFALLTPGGMHAADEEDLDLRRPDHPLHALYNAMHGLITEFRLFEESVRKEQQG